MKNLNSQTNHDRNIFNQIKNSIKKVSIETKREHPFNKHVLWNLFINEFKALYGIPFFHDPIVVKNIEAIFFYFLEDEKFFNCENLRTDVSAPSFKKGLMLFGSVGVGKTSIMKVFERIFNKYSPHRFKIIETYKVVDKYEEIITKADREYFNKSFINGTILFDDLNSEKMANNYGYVNIMKELLIRRCDINNKTHITINPTQGFENDINGSLLNLGENYDQRMVDRMYQMFNVIELTGKSMRR